MQLEEEAQGKIHMVEEMEAVLLGTKESVEDPLEKEDPNTFAVGAMIQLTIADTTQTRMVAVNSNFISHNSTDQIFGMGSNASGGIRVIWPDGSETIEPNVSAGQTLVITQP